MANESNSKQAENVNQNEVDAEASAGSVNQQGDQAEGSVAELTEALAAAQAEVESYKDRLLRVSAEMENLRRRAAIDVENSRKYGLEKIAGELLPVKDSLALGLEAASGENVEMSKVLEGVDLTLKMLVGVMAKFGIVEIDPINQKFNPDHHQAMSMQAVAGVAANTVVNVFQKGYLLNDRLLRPAMVVVSKQPPEQKGDDGSQKIDEMA